MITYELCLLIRVMPKTELASTLKRAASTIFLKGGVIKKLESLGTKDMPNKTSSHGFVHNKASYFLIEFHAPPRYLQDILEEYGRDVDVIRRRIYRKQEEEVPECTLNKEIQPPPYRKNVQDLIAQAKKVDKNKFKYNTGLDYYPFQK